jgi:hypothetical protein
MALLLATGVFVLLLGFIAIRKSNLAMHRKPYLDSNGPLLLGVGAVLIGAGCVLTLSAALVWLLAS